jgi:hypothetical protein
MAGRLHIGGLFVCAVTLLSMAWCQHARGQDSNASTEPLKYIDVYLRNEADHDFMESVHLRAVQWSLENDARVYRTFRYPLPTEYRRNYDTTAILPSDSWRLELEINPAYDTLSVLAFTRNVHYRPASAREYGREDWYKTEPLYSLPLSQYRQFLSSDELVSLARIIEQALSELATYSVHKNKAERILAVEWRWSDHQEWVLFSIKTAREAPYLCSWKERMHSFASPHDTVPLREQEIRERLMWSDGAGFEGERSIESILFTLQFIKLDSASPGPFGVQSFISYRITSDFVGLRYWADPCDPLWRSDDELMWMRKADFLRCYGNPLLPGWFDAIRANELEKKLLED